MLDTAAVALRLGHDPIRLLSREGLDRVVTEAVIHRAWDMVLKEEQERMAAMEVAVQNGVARAFGGGK